MDEIDGGGPARQRPPAAKHSKDSLTGWASRFLFGNDVFISYARRDATIYSLGLANELTKEQLSCFLDQWGAPPGTELPPALVLTLRRSNMLILLGTEEAANSRAVEQEVREFKRTGRSIIPVSFDGALEKAEWFAELIAGVSIAHESLEALKSGKPSGHVVTRIVTAENFMRRTERLRRYFWVTACSVVLVLLSGLLMGLFIVRQADAKARDAETRREEASARAGEAEQKRQAAEAEADRLSALAREAQGQQAAAERTAAEAARNEAAALANARDQRRIAAEQAARAEEHRKAADEQQRRSRRLTYIGNIQLAQQSFESGYTERGRKYLDAFLPASPRGAGAGREDLRGYEWHYLRRLFHRKLAEIPLGGDDASVNSVALSPRADQVVTAGAGGVKLWGASGSASAGLIATLAGGDFRHVGYSTDGGVIAAAAGGTVNLWDAATRAALRPIVQPDGKDFHALAFSPAHASRLATADENGVNVWDIEATSGKISRAAETIPLPREAAEGDSFSLLLVAFSPDGKHLGVDLDDMVEVWEMPSDGGRATRTAKTMVEGAPDCSTFFLLDRQTSATVFGEQVVTTDLNTGAVKSSFRMNLGLGSSADHHTQSTAVFSPGGKFLAAASAEGVTYGGEVKLWDASTGKLLIAFDGLGARGEVTALAFSGDGKTLAIGGRGKVQLSDATLTRDRLDLQIAKGNVKHMALSPDGDTLATITGPRRGKSTLDFWGTRTGELVHTRGAEAFDHISFAPDGTKYATAAYARRSLRMTWVIQLWDSRTHAPLGPPLGESSQPSLAFSPDGRTLAAAIDDYRSYDCRKGSCVQYWDVATGARSPTIDAPRGRPGRNTYGDAPQLYSPDGKLLVSVATSADGEQLNLLDASTRKRVAGFVSPTEGFFNSSVFSPDSKTLALAHGDSTVSLWDVAPLLDGSPKARGRDGAIWKVGDEHFLGMLEGHTAGVTAVAFSPDGRTIATAGEDGTVRLWEAGFYQPLAALKGSKGAVKFILFTPDGGTLAAACEDGSGGGASVSLWRAAEVRAETARQRR